MRLVEFFKQHVDRAGATVRLVERNLLSVGMSKYDVDLDATGDDVHMRVLQNGMDVGEIVYQDGEIVWIHVEPFFRKQGMGSAMVQYLQDHGYPVVMPDARTDDGRAFFDKLDQKGQLDEIDVGGSYDHDQAAELKKEIDYHDMNWYANGWLASEQDVETTGPKKFLIMDDDPIGFAYAQFGERPKFGKIAKTTMIWIDEEHRGEGLAGEYYDWLLNDLGRSLISDDKHSYESQSVWWKLVNKYVSYLNGEIEIDSWEIFDEAYERRDAFILVTPELRTTPVTPDPAFESTFVGQLDEVDGYSVSDIEQRREQMRQEPVKQGMFVMYRACPTNIASFQPMDYVTLKKEFAIEHAQHMMATEEEPYHVIRRMVDQDPRNPILFHAPNPGEFFYDGPELKGRILPVSLEMEEDLNEVFDSYPLPFRLE